MNGHSGVGTVFASFFIHLNGTEFLYRGYLAVSPRIPPSLEVFEVYRLLVLFITLINK